MNYYYDLKISSNVSRSCVPNLLSFKQEISKFERYKYWDDRNLSFTMAGDDRFTKRMSWDEPGEAAKRGWRGQDRNSPNRINTENAVM